MIILCYHGIKPEHKENFKWQMNKIHKRIGLNTAANDRHRGYNRHGYRLSITFDDAFANLLDNALPILEEYRIPALIFAVTNNLGCQPCWQIPQGHPEVGEVTMTAEQLTGISKNPLIRIGSHTRTHPDLTKVSSEQLKAELVDSRLQLEKLVDYPVEDLALPHGAYNDEVLRMAGEAGYKRIYTLDPKPADTESGSLVLGRFSMSPDVWKTEFLMTGAGAYTWLYPWRKFIRFVRKILMLAGKS